MTKKSKITLFIIGLFVITISTSSFVFASDVPFEVIKTKVHLEKVIPQDSDVVVVDGVPYDPSATSNKVDLGYPPPKGDFDHRVKAHLTGIKYSLDFWNVGQMGGEKGFFFKTDYGKAKLTIEYDSDYAYKMVSTGKSFGNLPMLEKKEVSVPKIKKFEYDLTFTGGPYGQFRYTYPDRNSQLYVGKTDGYSVTINSLPEHIHLAYSPIELPIKDSSAFEKWLSILDPEMSCDDIDDPDGDSGVRFSDYDGEVGVFPCGQDDSEYGAELDMVIHNKDIIRTHEDSTCVLSLADMTTFIMKPESMVSVAQRPAETKLHLIAGKVWVNFKRMMKDGTMDVEMSEAVAGIKGTTFVAEDTGSKSVLKVIEGHVKFTSKKDGRSEMIGPGEMITASERGLGAKRTFDVKEENDSWKSAGKSDSKVSVFLAAIMVLLVLVGATYLFMKRNKRPRHKRKHD